MNTIAPVDTMLINNFKGIQSALHKTLGKLEKQEMLDVFINNEAFSEKARLLVAEQVDKAYHGLFAGERVYSFAVTTNIDVLIIRVRKGIL